MPKSIGLFFHNPTVPYPTIPRYSRPSIDPITIILIHIFAIYSKNIAILFQK
jgi:hypothetical protein